MFELLGAAPKGSSYTVDPRARSVPRTERSRETLAWLDPYLGPVE